MRRRFLSEGIVRRDFDFDATMSTQATQLTDIRIPDRAVDSNPREMVDHDGRFRMPDTGCFDFSQVFDIDQATHRLPRQC